MQRGSDLMNRSSLGEMMEQQGCLLQNLGLCSSFSLHVYQQVFCASNMHLAFAVYVSVICIHIICSSVLHESLVGHRASEWTSDGTYLRLNPRAGALQCPCAQK